VPSRGPGIAASAMSWCCAVLVALWPLAARADVEAPPSAPAGDSTLPVETSAGAQPPARAGAAPPPEAPPGLSGADLDAARRSYQFKPGVPCPFCEPSAAFPRGPSGLHWHDHWRSVGWPEYSAIALSAATYAGLQFLPAAQSPSWESPILFDTAARNLLRLNSASARSTAESVSDILSVAEVAYPLLVDPLLAWAVRESPSVAWQMSVIDAQAFAFTLVLNEATKRLTSRERPYVDQCEVDPSGAHCNSSGRYLSFYSGHAAMTATGAGLICAHHTQLNLYQNGALDLGTCALGILATTVTGVMRVASDNHWASDVLVGDLQGYLSGYLLPTLLYYKEFRASPSNEAPGRPTVAALPMVGNHSLQLSLLGAF